MKGGKLKAGPFPLNPHTPKLRITRKKMGERKEVESLQSFWRGHPRSALQWGTAPVNGRRRRGRSLQSSSRVACKAKVDKVSTRQPHPLNLEKEGSIPPVVSFH